MRYRLSWSLLLLLVAAPVCAQSADAEPPSDDAPTTVFRHPGDQRWYIAGQINIIFQAHPGFYAPYSGANSLKPWGQSAGSRVFTLYTGVQTDAHDRVPVRRGEQAGPARIPALSVLSRRSRAPGRL